MLCLLRIIKLNLIIEFFVFRLVNTVMLNGVSAAYLAAQEGHLEVLSYLVAEGNASVWDTSNDGMTCLHAAALSGQLPVLKWLVGSLAETIMLWDLLSVFLYVVNIILCMLCACNFFSGLYKMLLNILSELH